MRSEELAPSATRTDCPYKGAATYLSITDGPRDVAWSYAQPFAAVGAIAGRWAFYASKVTVEVTPETR